MKFPRLVETDAEDIDLLAFFPVDPHRMEAAGLGSLKFPDEQKPLCNQPLCKKCGEPVWAPLDTPAHELEQMGAICLPCAVETTPQHGVQRKDMIEAFKKAFLYPDLPNPHCDRIYTKLCEIWGESTANNLMYTTSCNFRDIVHALMSANIPTMAIFSVVEIFMAIAQDKIDTSELATGKKIDPFNHEWLKKILGPPQPEIP